MPLLESGIDIRAARRAFNRTARTYETAAVVPREIRNQLFDRLDLTPMSPRCVLDIGAATGGSTRALQQRYPRARVIGVDFAFERLRLAQRTHWFRRKFAVACADAHQLPLADASVDVVFSNLTATWCDVPVLFRELRRVMAPDALLALTCFGPDTLRELRAASATADASTSHVDPFVDIRDVGDALVRAGFAQPVLDVERYDITYANVRALLSELGQLGMRAAFDGRRRTLTGARQFAAFEVAYRRAAVDGRIPVSVEVVFAKARALASTARNESPEVAEAVFPLGNLEAQLPTRRR